MPNLTPGDVHVPAPLGSKRKERKGDPEPEALEAGIAEESEEHPELPADVIEQLVRDHLAGDPTYYAKSGHSVEYLTAFHAAAKDALQGWQHDQIHSLALPRAGGAAGRRKPEHTETERALLSKLTRDHVGEMADEKLVEVWKELARWHALASRKHLDTADYERAANVLAEEMDGRNMTGLDGDSTLAQAMLAKSAEPETSISAGPLISKAWNEKRIIWYAMGVPGEVDTYGDEITRDAVEDAAHRYMQNGCPIYLEHGETVGLNAGAKWPKLLSPGLAVCVESGITFAPTLEVFGSPLARPLPEGTWFVANLYKDVALWELLKNVPHGGSWRGTARRSK